ncbi:MAG TPA: G1 family glutamic endopeptidase [Streptosporangiaceae bacterium]
MRLLNKLRAGYPVLALIAALVTATGPTVTASAAPLPGAKHGPAAVATARTALEHLLAGMPHADGTPGCQGGTTSVDSPTWAGYADCSPSSGPALTCPPQLCYSGVAGSWLVPYLVRCEDCLAVSWLGLDGFSSSTMEQAGLLADQSGGSTSYYTWWDMYPSGVHIVGTTVRAGDSISASVQREGTSYILSLTDATTPANSFTTTQSCTSCANSSAEWITQGQPGIPLADFGTWRVTGATAAAGSAPAGIGAFPCAQITMVGQSGRVMVQPGPLDGTGTSFASTWRAST